MAFTEQEESKLRSLIEAFDGGQQIDDLPDSDNDVSGKLIEIHNTKTGASEKKTLRDAVRLASAPYFGRVWNNANGTPTAAGWVGSIEFGRHLADYLKLGCYLVKNDHTRRKLDPSNHYRFATGETAKLDGSMGHYQWGWGVKFYLAFYEMGGLFHEEVSLSPIPGQYNYVIPIGSISAHGLACIDRTTSTLVSYVNDDPNYRGGNNTSGWDETYRTLCGRAVTNMTCENMRAAARRNGTGWMCGTMRHSAVVKVLFEIIFGTRNVQAAYNSSLDADGLHQGGLGDGVTTLTSSQWSNYNSYNPFLPTTVGIELGDSCGVSSYAVEGSDGNTAFTVSVPVFFGLKNAYGYIWRHQDDEFFQVNADKSLTHLVAPSIYGSWTIGNATGMVAYSTTPGYGDGFIKTVSYDHLEMCPTQTGGSESTYHCDRFYNTSNETSGFRLVLRGGSARHGAAAGLVSVDGGDAVSGSYAILGSPLCEAAEEWSVEPVYAAAA